MCWSSKDFWHSESLGIELSIRIERKKNGINSDRSFFHRLGNLVLLLHVRESNLGAKPARVDSKRGIELKPTQ